MKTILVVDDEQLQREAIEEKLRNTGYQVISAVDGEEALTIIERTSEIDLILLDIVMPKMGGQMLIYYLNRMGRNIPIILLTNLTEFTYQSTVSAHFIKSQSTLEEITDKIKVIIGT
jgi:two-component system, cell cycle sensor histidine kinase and response regulator CckA